MDKDYSEDLQRILRDIDSPSLYPLINENEEIVIEVDSRSIAISRRGGHLYTKLLSSANDYEQELLIDWPIVKFV
ncbi:MAG: hypothetical protein ACXABY_29835 [Candidatus Thorarchaeota archaeon]|jgi:hypothetical protein